MKELSSASPFCCTGRPGDLLQGTGPGRSGNPEESSPCYSHPGVMVGQLHPGWTELQYYRTSSSSQIQYQIWNKNQTLTAPPWPFASSVRTWMPFMRELHHLMTSSPPNTITPGTRNQRCVLGRTQTARLSWVFPRCQGLCPQGRQGSFWPGAAQRQVGTTVWDLFTL